jgi:hypothetical protein
MQGMKLELVISHIRAGSALGKLYRININYLQLHSGVETPVLESSKELSSLEQNWLTQFREFLITVNGKLKIRDLWRLKRQ